MKEGIQYPITPLLITEGPLCKGLGRPTYYNTGVETPEQISRFTKSRFDERLAAVAAHDFVHLRFCSLFPNPV